MSEVRPNLLITLVHGTWGRGFFPRRQRNKRRPFWFEEGSPFLAGLSGELGDVPHKLTPRLWSGANSIFVRDETANALAEYLSAEHTEDPQATQLVIAHSHGGNIALRALHHLCQRNATSGGKESANPLVVTLATPFIEVHQADFGRKPFYIRLALTIFVLGPLLSALVIGILSGILLFFIPELFNNNIYAAAAPAGFLLGVFVTGRWWIVRRAPARRNKLDALKDATRLGELASAQRLLVIRAIDDEAALIMALGTILNYVTGRFIIYVLLLYFGFSLFLGGAPGFRDWLFTVAVGSLTLTIILFGMLIVSRSVHGQELAVSPLECQINTQSTPNAIGLSKIVTLVSRTKVKSLRHGIYGNEDCPKAISDWVRSQLHVPDRELGDMAMTRPLS